MIAANVCAAETLEAARHPCMYRVHDEPPPDRLAALRRYLKSLGLGLAGGQAVRPRHFAQTIERVRDTAHARAVSEVILRAQAQAVYSPENLGHFGLALRRYSHFTSPIRRYSDLVIHRALIDVTGPGGNSGNSGDGGDGGDGEDLVELGKHLSMTERRATAAERDTMDRLMAAYLADRVGAEFDGMINGVERFGLFVTLNETGADGLLPVSALGEDSFRLDRDLHMLVGRRSGEEFRLGDKIRVRLVDADALTSTISFALTDRTAHRPERPGPRRGPRKGVRRRGKRR